MQKFYFLSLLILACSRLNEVEFNKDLNFDINNNIFEFTGQTSGSLFIAVKFSVGNLVRLNVSYVSSGKYSEESSVEKNGLGVIVDLNKGANVKLEFKYSKSSNEKGTVWMNPSTNIIKVDLNKIYKWKFDISKWIYNRDMNLTYSIENAEKNVKFIFEYKNEIEGQKVNNPFEVCHGSECKTDITTYDFVKGESYKIYVRGTKYLFPSFSFHDINIPDQDTDSGNTDSGNYSYYLSLNLWIISLILLLL